MHTPQPHLVALVCVAHAGHTTTHRPQQLLSAVPHLKGPAAASCCRSAAGNAAAVNTADFLCHVERSCDVYRFTAPDNQSQLPLELLLLTLWLVPYLQALSVAPTGRSTNRVAVIVRLA